MTGGFDHFALLYHDAEEYLAGTLPFIRAGLTAGEPVVVAVPGANLDLIRHGLGPAAGQIQLSDMTIVGRNPGRLLPGLVIPFLDAHPGTRVRVIGEPIWPGQTELEYAAGVQHEALGNLALEHREITALCPYDAARLHGRAIDDAYRTHPLLAETATGTGTGAEAGTGTGGRSSWYADPLVVAAEFNRPLPEPPEWAATMNIDVTALAVIRRFILDLADAAGMELGRAIDLAIAVNELAINTVEHGGGHGRLTVWLENGTVVCQVRDSGHIADPLAGRIPPPAGQPRGRGLILVNQICDLVRVHATPEETTIRLQMRR